MKITSSRRSIALRFSFVVAIIAGAIAALPALAAPPVSSTFNVAELFNVPNGTFMSDGSVVCASGTTSNSDFHTSGSQSNQGIVFHDRKTITCNDGSGSFTLLLKARTGFNVSSGGTSGTWVVLSGTGDYTNLHGQGSLTGTYTPGFVGINETYVGALALR